MFTQTDRRNPRTDSKRYGSLQSTLFQFHYLIPFIPKPPHTLLYLHSPLPTSHILSPLRFPLSPLPSLFNAQSTPPPQNPHTHLNPQPKFPPLSPYPTPHTPPPSPPHHLPTSQTPSTSKIPYTYIPRPRDTLMGQKKNPRQPLVTLIWSLISRTRRL